MKLRVRDSISIFIVSILWTFNLFAGDKAGNGGDSNEQKFKEIAVNIQQWIESGNADNIILPKNISLENYKKLMLSALAHYSVSFTSEKVLVSGVEKTCKNSTESDNKSQILCNNERFEAYYKSNINEVYLIIHHEFAGISGLEISNGQDSDYSISNQISGFLQTEVVKRLPVIKQNSNSDFISCNDPYTGSFHSNIENGWFIFSLKAHGYVEVLPLANKLGLQLEKPITNLEFRIPSTECSWIQGLAQLSCYNKATLLLFKTENGSTTSMNVDHIKISTGVVGVGQSSSQLIEIEIDASRSVRELNSYAAQWRGTGGWFLCGRAVTDPLAEF